MRNVRGYSLFDSYSRKIFWVCNRGIVSCPKSGKFKLPLDLLKSKVIAVQFQARLGKEWVLVLPKNLDYSYQRVSRGGVTLLGTSKKVLGHPKYTKSQPVSRHLRSPSQNRAPTRESTHFQKFPLAGLAFSRSRAAVAPQRRELCVKDAPRQW